MNKFDISKEASREYDIPGRETPYRIENPITLFTRDGGTTHRVLDANNVVHCVPIAGAVIRWTPKDPSSPVQF